MYIIEEIGIFVQQFMGMLITVGFLAIIAWVIYEIKHVY